MSPRPLTQTKAFGSKAAQNNAIAVHSSDQRLYVSSRMVVDFGIWRALQCCPSKLEYWLHLQLQFPWFFNYPNV